MFNYLPPLLGYSWTLHIMSLDYGVTIHVADYGEYCHYGQFLEKILVFVCYFKCIWMGVLVTFIVVLLPTEMEEGKEEQSQIGEIQCDVS